MQAEVIIDCEEAYQIRLTAKDLRVFERAKAHPSTKNKTGEELVAAVVALGGISKLDRRKKETGQRSDGPQGEPCLIMFNDNGTPRAIRRFTNGVLNDGKNGEIAVQQFNHTGDKLIYALRYNKGVRGHKLTKAEMEDYVAKNALGRTASKSISGINNVQMLFKNRPL